MNYDFFLYLLKAGLVLAILTVAYAWLVKRETFLQVNRWLLWVNVAATLSLPIIPMPDFEWMPDAPAKVVAEVIPSRQALPDSKPSKKYEELTVAPLPNSKSLENQDAAPISSALTFWDWMGMVYVLVVGLLTLKLAIQLGTLWRLKRNGVNYEPEDGVQLVESEKITAPFSFFHWVFYNPIHHNDDEWAQIWAHECIHVHQRHSIDMLTAEAMKIVFWFNPFAWWHQRLVQETLEFITDRAVLESGVEKKSYQYHLLRSTLSADKQTFTNHFNQSLLKNRITMMNRTKSKWLGLGKYGVFIGMLWLCAAFTKPYRAKVAAKIVEKVPELGAVLQPKVAEKPVLKDFVLEESLNKLQTDTAKMAVETSTTAEADTQLVSATKYVVYKGNYFHFLITAKTTFEDLVKIRQELDRNGMSLEILAWQMDSLGRYIRKAEVVVRSLSGSPRLIARGKDMESKPIKPIAMTLPIKKMSNNNSLLTMYGGDIPAEQSLKVLAELDNEFADFDVRWSQSVAGTVEKYRRKGIYFVPLTFFPAKKLFKEDSPQFFLPFAIMTNEAQKEVLKVNPSLKNAKFRLNDSPAALAEIENIPPDKFIKADKYEVYDEKKAVSEIYMLVYTKQ
jgi:hypothetical protein